MTDKTGRHAISTTARAVLVVIISALAGCSTLPEAPSVMPAGMAGSDVDSNYLIGPTDQLTVTVWRQPELSTQAVVRPDGKLSIPLINDLPAAGRTPTEFGDAVALALKEYVQDPKVTVMVTTFVGPFDRQIRVVGEAAKPQAIAFRRNMTVLDVMIQVGGLTEYANGNRAALTRTSPSGPRQQFRLRLADLLNDGDPRANAYVMPGDVIVIPQSYF